MESLKGTRGNIITRNSINRRRQKDDFFSFPRFSYECDEHQILLINTFDDYSWLFEADVKKRGYKNAGIFLQISCFSLLQHTNFLQFIVR